MGGETAIVVQPDLSRYALEELDEQALPEQTVGEKSG